MTVVLERSYYTSLCWYGLKKLGFAGGDPDPDYTDWSDRLSELGGDFAFAAPLAGGPVFTFVYQIPGYINPADTGELEAIEKALLEFIQARSIEPFTSRWPQRTRFWDSWYVPPSTSYLFGTVEGREEEVSDLVHRFFDFISELWPAYTDEYEDKLEGYPFKEWEQHSRELSPLDAWRKEFGLSYPYSDFQLVICPESRTAASSLGPEKVVFGAMHNKERLENSVVHEAGVRFLDPGRLSRHPATRKLALSDYEGILRLVETEVCYRKPRLLPGLVDDPFIRGMRLQELVAWRSTKEPLPDIFESLASWYQEATAEGLL